MKYLNNRDSSKKKGSNPEKAVANKFGINIPTILRWTVLVVAAIVAIVFSVQFWKHSDLKEKIAIIQNQSYNTEEYSESELSENEDLFVEDSEDESAPVNNEQNTQNEVVEQEDSEKQEEPAKQEETEEKEEPVVEQVIDPEEFFSDVIFVGDSITIGLHKYCQNYGVFTEAEFYYTGNYSVHHAANDSMKIYYAGSKRTIESAIKASGKNKVFILLGANDVNAYKIESTIKKWNTLIKKICKKNPDVKIYVQSCTPAYIGGEKKVNNARIDEYNQELKGFCQKNDIEYIDIATPLKDESGGLAKKYTSDYYIRLSKDGNALWVETLIKYVTGE